MSIRIRVAGLYGGRPLNEVFEEPYEDHDTPRKILERLDEKKALGRKFLSRLASRENVTILLNGKRLDCPEDLDKFLTDGDDISVLSAIAGG